MWEIVAIMASPLIAFLVGKMVTDRSTQRERRHRLFESLWLTQHIGVYGRMSPEHVRALNMVEIEFARTKGDDIWDDGASRRVLAAWSAYHSHLNIERPTVSEVDNPDPTQLAAASDRQFGPKKIWAKRDQSYINSEIITRSINERLLDACQP